MGSHAITYAVVALAIAVSCLIAGFFWGRSNAKVQVELAIEKEHVALDAREFAMRTQLEDAIAELAKLRPLAEDPGRLKTRTEREQTTYSPVKAGFDASRGIATEPTTEGNSDPEPQSLRAQESADEAIQKLLQSLEVFNDPGAPGNSERDNPGTADAVIAESATDTMSASRQPADIPNVVETPAPAPPKPIAVTPLPEEHKAVPVETRETLLSDSKEPGVAARSSVRTKPAPAESAKSAQTIDEWQEFARQLEALTGKKK